MSKEEGSRDILRMVLALFCSPLAVYLQLGTVKNKHFWINIPLWLCFDVPGFIHAMWVILKYDEK